MATAKKPNSKRVQLPQLDPGAVLVSISEYLRMKNALEQGKDIHAPIVYASAVYRNINDGYMETVKMGRNTFIDWNKYQHFVFKTSNTEARRKKVLEAGK